MFLGIADEEFIRGDVPMTKREIRILTLAEARIAPTDVVWDIGAGTGSMSVEAACLAAEGWVYAVERNAEGVALIKKNAEKFGVKNLTVVEREAPTGLNDLPACDAAVIGGSGSHLAEIFDAIAARMKTGGRIIVNCVTIQTLATALTYLRRHKAVFAYEATQVQVNRLRPVGPYDMAQALNPIYIIACQRK
ncbi:MAG: precorrin-6Y C5,15-methyltransferase (decarboxylating) subunit CbiT [Oscillospiraceae bacterium]|nr:precorrin-6Y C5,15-methyltransferase (decarboxylating) subunit CbiT [Oscillospiraceae bacterium]